MRTLTDHIVNPVNDKLTVTVTDQPGAGGANHEYHVTMPHGFFYVIKFQNGPINEAGVNGLTHEALLAIIIDRLRSFQTGQFPCRENALALTHCEDALHWLQHRTRKRMERGVEGKTLA